MSNLRVVDNVISDKHVESFIKNEYKPKNFHSQLTNMTVFVIETFSANRAVSYRNVKYKHSNKIR